MNQNWLPLVLTLALLAIALGHGGYYYPQLPKTVASHFDVVGRADGWSSKESLMVEHAATLLGSAAVFLSLGWLLRLVPRSMVSLPNKDYWLADDRKAATYATLNHQLLWFGCATLAFLLILFHLTVRANLDGPPELRGCWWLLGCYLGFVAIWCVACIRRFARLPRQSPIR